MATKEKPKVWGLWNNRKHWREFPYHSLMRLFRLKFRYQRRPMVRKDYLVRLFELIDHIGWDTPFGNWSMYSHDYGGIGFNPWINLFPSGERVYWSDIPKADEG
jgi:hypothetical protein